ncbi:MAG: TRAP transporter small permease [Chloroflexi bacterium]|nr:TRAP transporter small permease [Chloroflexota bacterium]
MFDRVFNRVLVAGAILTGAITAYVMLSVDLEVVLRYGFTRPTSWVLDFTEYALVYITFLTSAWLLSKDGHVKIDVILERLPAKAQRALNITTSIIATIACLLFFVFSAWMTLEAAQRSEFLVHGTIVPKWSIWIAMPLGSLLLTIQYVRRTMDFIKGRQIIAAAELKEA